MLVDGTATRIAAGSEFQRLLLRFVRSIIVLVSRAAACFRFHPVENRPARWLLRTSDRSGSNTLKISKLLLANMLGVRREGLNRATTKLRK